MKYIFLILFLLINLVTSAQQVIELCAGETKTVTYTSIFGGDGDNIWTVNGSPYMSEDLTYTFSQAGTYNIILKRENGPCYVEQTLQVVVTECPGITYYIPNSFTPDDNEHNQLFGPIMTDGYDVNGFVFSIFNRWGEKIWESNDPNGMWDGTYNGVMCQDGVYTWKLLFNVFGNDGKITDSGFVTLIR
jgi:gliding motility-associated-like protein